MATWITEYVPWITEYVRVSSVIGFVKGKSAVRIHRELLNIRRMTGLHFWARGYCVSTVGMNEEAIREYMRNQEKLDNDQPNLEF